MNTTDISSVWLDDRSDMVSMVLLVLLTAFALVGAVNAEEEAMFGYGGIYYQRASLDIDEDGSTAIEDEADSIRVFAASKLYQSLYLEYGYQDLGEFTADYEFDVGNFRFVESHEVELSHAVFAGFALMPNLGQLFEQPALDRLYLKLAAGGLLWHARIDVAGDLYDTGSLFDSYGATGNGTGVSRYFGAGFGYRVAGNLVLNIEYNVHMDVGRGVELLQLDGSTRKYGGKDARVPGIGFTWMFQAGP